MGCLTLLLRGFGAAAPPFFGGVECGFLSAVGGPLGARRGHALTRFINPGQTGAKYLLYSAGIVARFKIVVATLWQWPGVSAG